ncbi:hypothetical protein LBMAG12_10850 [Actinomycetes bacterium]|nr:hypothetical protein LBMAG12_10850 [Actinomycetes bacterium]
MASTNPNRFFSTALGQIIRRRRMTRTFDGGPSLEDLTKLGELALRAPSAGFSQGAHLLILVGEDLQRFWRESGSGDWFATKSPGVLSAQAVILVLADESAYTNRYSQSDKAGHGLEEAENWGKPTWLTDAALVTQNLLLLIEEQRWGALLFDLFKEPRKLLETFGVPPKVHCAGVVAVGFRHSEDQKSGSPTRLPRKASVDLLHIGTWNTHIDDSLD